jgi:FAD/FMN-containing dehydrogenase/Fe-S oxidoreductase
MSKGADFARTGLDSTDARRLAADLKRVVRGEVRFDDATRAVYAHDASVYRQVPIGVVLPWDVDDIVRTVEVSRAHGVPVLTRGGGTSQAGQCCNVAVVIDTSKYATRIHRIDGPGRRAWVEAGTNLDDLQDAAKPHGLAFGPVPSTHDRCTLGGMIGNNSCGGHSVVAGKTDDNTVELDILTYDGLRMTVGPTSDEELARIIAEGGRRGEIYSGLKGIRDKYADLIRSRFPKIPRRVSGYNLDRLLPEHGFQVAQALVGSEGTCVTVLGATLQLMKSPPARVLLALGYPDAYQAGDHVVEVTEAGAMSCEGLDSHMVEYMRRKALVPAAVAMLPEGGGWLIAEFGGETMDEASGKARKLMEQLKASGNGPAMRLFEAPAERARMTKLRESGFGASSYVPGMKPTWPGWEDSAVPPERLGDYLRDLRKLLDRYGYNAGYYGHFGQACIHMLIDFDLMTAPGIKSYRSFLHDAADLVISYGGSVSGEHGDGQVRAELLPKMFGPELMDAFREFKTIWDPQRKMNPGKLIDAYRADENLKFGVEYNPPKLETHFQFPQDDGSFANATIRCSGVGKCRGVIDGTMCPSYMVTKEEIHSTRGRARLLFEMLEGKVLKGGWRNQQVKESLDLCLACKGCKGDCPVRVDMGTYKAEFLSHYYEGRLRPRASYAFGMIMYWARLAELAPGIVNFFTQSPVLSAIAKAAMGIAPERRIPVFASRTFKQWFQDHRPRNPNGQKVVLWADTFNNHLTPEPIIAAVEVLEAAGYRVEVPSQRICCGRPLYDHGMLTLAKRLLRQTLAALGPEIDAGTPVVGLEPSCMAVFRDELVNFFPEDERARRLSKQSFLLSEFLEKAGFDPPKLRRKAVVHGHCHHKAVMTMRDEEAQLAKTGLDCKLLDAGCCGMAGVFGFQKEHYGMSMEIGERVLLPEVRKADRDTIIIADGFSCREQIAQSTDREAMHFAEVLALALREGENGPPGDYPERRSLHMNGLNGAGRGIDARRLAVIGMAVGGAVALGRLRARGRKPQG